MGWRVEQCIKSTATHALFSVPSGIERWIDVNAEYVTRSDEELQAAVEQLRDEVEPELLSLHEEFDEIVRSALHQAVDGASSVLERRAAELFLADRGMSLSRVRHPVATHLLHRNGDRSLVRLVFFA